MKQVLFSTNSKVIGYDLVTCVILYGKDGTKRSYDIANFGTRKCAMIKAVVLSWMTDALWNGHVEIL